MQGKPADAPEFDRFVRAQQTWDRAFACNIAAYLNEQPEALVVGIIGSGHMALARLTNSMILALIKWVFF